MEKKNWPENGFILFWDGFSSHLETMIYIVYSTAAGVGGIHVNCKGGQHLSSKNFWKTDQCGSLALWCRTQ